jgi:uncharacterized tellurite resistance protein B-like protein
MIDWLKSLLQPPSEERRTSRLEAIAGLLVQAGAMDGQFDQRERRAVEDILLRFDAVDGAAARTAITAVEPKVAHGTDLFQFTREINVHFAPEERLSIVEALWEVILADGEVDTFEASLMRRLGTLIHVSDRDIGEARQRVAARRQSGQKPRLW